VNKTLATLNPTEAARVAYPNSKNPDMMAVANMRKPKILALIEKHVLDVDVAVVLKEQLHAKKKIYDPSIKSLIDEPDNAARLKAVDIALKVKDAYPGGSGAGVGNSFTFIVQKGEGRKFEDYETEEEIPAQEIEGEPAPEPEYDNSVIKIEKDDGEPEGN